MFAKKISCDTTVSSTNLEINVFEFVHSLYFVLNLFSFISNSLVMPRTWTVHSLLI